MNHAKPSVVMVQAEMSNGEGRTLASLATGVTPEDLEAYLVIAFIHRSPHDHDVVITGDVIGYRPMADSLVNMAQKMIEQGQSHAGENIKPTNSSKAYRLVCQLHHRGWFGHK